MLKRILSYTAVVIVSVLLTTIFQPLRYVETLAQGQAGCQTFPDTGKTVCGRFLQYWQQHGGVAQQGFPLSNEFKEVSDLNGLQYTVQYFERAVFEMHPENKAPYDVLLSQLGTFRFQTKYHGLDPSPSATPVPGADGEPLHITLQDFKILYDDPATRPLTLDARSNIVYQMGHINGAVSFQVADAAQRVGELPKDKLIVVYSQEPVENQSASLARVLHNQHGFSYDNLKVLLGGWNVWLAANAQNPLGYPITKGPFPFPPR